MTETPRRGHGWWPYLGPYGLFLVLVEVGRRMPESADGAMLVVKVGLPAALIVYFAAKGRYPELRGYRPSAGELLLDVGVGLGIAAFWLAPYLLFPSLPRGEEGSGFDAGVLGEGGEALALAIRLFGFAVVTPFVEELFVRSFLLRYVDVFDTGGDFRDVPIARFTWRSFLFTSAWFTLTHVPWEWIVAAPAGVAFNLWLYRRRHIGAPIVAHAVANGSIGAAVLLGPPELGVFL